jgi:hypothetical protein
MFAYSLRDLRQFMEITMQTKQAILAEAVFVAKVAYRELNQVPKKAKQSLPQVILYNDLMKLVSGGLGSNKKEQIDKLISGINKNLVLRKQYSDLLKRLSFATCPALAAASSKQDMPSRQTDNMLLKFKRDGLERTQIFALLSIDNPSNNHTFQGVVVNVISKEHCERIEFPPLIDGTTQRLFDESDTKLQFLLDLDAEISIMP